MDEVTAVLKSQADAWNHGDLSAFMAGYLNSPTTSYVSSDSEVYGYQALKQRYEKRYGTDSSTMGKLDFSDLKTFPLGSDHALCIGHWHVAAEGKPDLRGVFSVILARTSSGWKIVHDHTSMQSNAN